MSGRIKILDEAVINRIAAGEVVERPVSVVKELVENSIDAGATSIQVEIENGGKKLIRVKDNGLGMSHDDSFLALERHATSKLSSEKDLQNVATMGFRGEALASIASVSRLRLRTNDESDVAGTEIIIEGGVLRKSVQVGMPRGTVIEVANLFYNVPVRRKFLKTVGVEAAYIQELVTKIALASTSVGFIYSEDGRVKLDTPPVKTTFERIHTLYSRDVRENLAEVDYSVEEARLRGYVAKPPYARSSMRSVLTFVNGRPVRDRLVNAAVNRAFSSLVERGRYPLAILFIELPPEELDVNVHPQKAEVRFLKPRQISDLILDGVYKAIMGAPFNPPPGGWESIFPRSPAAPVSRHVQEEAREPETASRFSTPASPSAEELETPRPESPTPLTEAPGRFSSLGILGSLPGSFLVLHSDDELIVMDHHAAHERVLFDDLVRSDRQGDRLPSQDLLMPTLLEYPPVEARALAAHLDILQSAGFRIEEFGENDFLVKGVPTWLGSSDVNELVNELIDVILDTGLRTDPAKFREEMFKTMACKAAVKETQPMRPEEIRNLLAQLDQYGSPGVCPHGRPLMVKFPFSEIRRRIGRK